MTTRILILNGPNLNLLGTRQPEVYGHTSLTDIHQSCTDTAAELGLMIDFRQSNHEGELVDWIQDARHSFDGIILNAGAYTHTSVAIMDAIGSIDTPVLELHLSNIHQRETFRHTSYISKVAFGMICGLGAAGYPLALRAIKARLDAAK